MATFAFQQNKFIFIFAGLMLLGGALWYGYQFVDGSFLTEKEATAKVVGKEHVPFAEKYQMMNVGGVNRTVKIAVPETWLLVVDVEGDQAKAGVDHDVFLEMKPGTEVKVRYKKRRVTGNTQVTQYLGPAGN
jgi:hypothetical protein